MQKNTVKMLLDILPDHASKSEILVHFADVFKIPCKNFETENQTRVAFVCCVVLFHLSRPIRQNGLDAQETLR